MDDSSEQPLPEIQVMLDEASLLDAQGHAAEAARLLERAAEAEARAGQPRPYALASLIIAIHRHFPPSEPNEPALTVLVAAYGRCIAKYDEFHHDSPVRPLDVLTVRLAMMLFDAGLLAHSVSILTSAIASADRKRPINADIWRARHLLASVLADAGRFDSANAMHAEAIEVGKANGFDVDDAEQFLREGGYGPGRS